MFYFLSEQISSLFVNYSPFIIILFDIGKRSTILEENVGKESNGGVYTIKQTWSKLRAHVVHVYIQYICFLFASSCKHSIK